ncbi:MAG: hypothetical protein IJC98_04745 [Clostridia bacterium]|nr:hypothetical protein [Clostridia bacterium]
MQKGWEVPFFGWEAVLFHNAFSSCFLLLFFRFSSFFFLCGRCIRCLLGKKTAAQSNGSASPLIVRERIWIFAMEGACAVSCCRRDTERRSGACLCL